MTLFDALLRIAALLLIFRVARAFMALRVLLLLRVRAGTQREVEPDAIPPYLRALLEHAEPWVARGFEHVAWVTDDTVFGPPPYVPRYRRVMRRPGSGLWLWLEVREVPDAEQPLQATLTSTRASGALVQSNDEPGASHWMRYPSDYVHELHPGAEPDALIDAHLRAAGTELVLDDPLEAHGEAVRAANERMIAHAIALGDLRAESDGTAAPRLLPALARAIRLPATKATKPAGAEIPIELEVDLWERMDAIRAARTPGALALLLLVATAAAFGLSLLVELDPTNVVILAGAVAFHELGHWLAMRLRGYHDARIFFVPFFGGATIGHKERATLGDEIVVLLAGPVPGLAVGLAIAVLGALVELPELVTRVAIILLAINGLNLLPLFPLDGGRIVHRLLGHGRPLVEGSLRVLGVAGMAALGVWWEAWVMVLIAVFLGLRIPIGVRIARVERAIRDGGVPEDARARRTATIRALREAFPTFVPAVRAIQARELATRLDAPASSLAARFGWGVVYLALLAVPATGVVMAAMVSQDDEAWTWVGCGEPLPDAIGTASAVRVVPYGQGDQPLERLPDALVTYVVAGALVCVPEPWRVPPNDARRAVEASLVRVVRALDDAMQAEHPTEIDPDAEPGEWRSRRDRAIERTRAQLAAERASELDMRIAEVWLAARSASDDRGLDAERARLAELLGVPLDCPEGAPARVVSLRSPRASEVQLWSESAPAEAANLLPYLCREGARGAFVSPAPGP